MQEILSYGGGRQTAAMVVLVVAGHLPRPDRIIIADTGREKQSTWDYLHGHIQPLLATIDMQVEIAPRSLAYVDLFGKNGDFLMPLYTKTGKMSAFCSTEWKARVVDRYLRSTGITESRRWIGFSYDEIRRVKGESGRWYPLIDRMLTKADCMTIIKSSGLPIPAPSACYMCPNMSDGEWRYIRDTYPHDFLQACRIDAELRAEDMERGGSGVWVHRSRVPLAEAVLDGDDTTDNARQCGLGMCFV